MEDHRSVNFDTHTNASMKNIWPSLTYDPLASAKISEVIINK